MRETDYRNERILNLVPSDVKTVLDIGSRGDIFVNYTTTTVDTVENSDVKQDLNKNQKLPFKDNSFDLVVMNQILEHLSYVEEIISEAKRVSKKYILVGLPNELTYGSRIKSLIGTPDWSGYKPFGHKHFFTINKIENFVSEFFGKHEDRVYFFACSGARFIPENLRDFLAILRPSLFAKEVYYLINIKKSS